MSGPEITTTDGRPADEVRREQMDEGNTLHRSYVVLTPEERAKGFVRPVRKRYRHVGPAGPKHPTRTLTAEEHERYDRFGYVAFEAYPDGDHAGSVTGRYWTQAQLDAVGRGCDSITTMGLAIAETYAREPRFYSSTYCVMCGKHFPVGESGEFVWIAASGELTDERVGS